MLVEHDGSDYADGSRIVPLNHRLVSPRDLADGSLVIDVVCAAPEALDGESGSDHVCRGGDPSLCCQPAINCSMAAWMSSSAEAGTEAGSCPNAERREMP